MGGLAYQRLHEGALSRILQSSKGFVFQKPRACERLRQMLHQTAHVQIACELHQMCAQIQFGMLAIEQFQAPHQGGRNDQRGVRKLKRIAHQQARPVRNW